MFRKENTLEFSKQEIRKTIQTKRLALAPELVEEHSAEIRKALLASSAYGCAETIACYVSVKNEVDTTRFIKHALDEGKRVCVPQTLGAGVLEHTRIRSLGELKPARFGLLEPSEGLEICPGELDLVIIPGVAFNNSGNRIGFGAGYYDRYLTGLQVLKVGLAYDFQILQKVPDESHDIALDIIITQTRVLNCSGGHST